MGQGGAGRGWGRVPLAGPHQGATNLFWPARKRRHHNLNGHFKAVLQWLNPELVSPGQNLKSGTTAPQEKKGGTKLLEKAGL